MSHTIAASGDTAHISVLSYFLTFLALEKTCMRILGDSRVTGKFQTTIPKAVRDLLDINSGDRIVFIAKQGNVFVKKGKLEVQA
jgi:AbrB family looped-hinge helix DNA binding protein